MEKQFQVITQDKLSQYAELFVKVFNEEPWFDHWTIETATKRLEEMMSNPCTKGLACYINNELVGVILGRKEQYYDGVHFQIQEFYISNSTQGMGIGTALLERFKEELIKEGITQIYLMTLKGERTEGFYNKKGFETDKMSVLMNMKLH